MQIKKGTTPSFVDRNITVEVDRSDLFLLVKAYVEKGLKNKVELSEIEAIASEDGKLESITLMGIEKVPLVWNSNQESVSANNPELNLE